MGAESGPQRSHLGGGLPPRVSATASLLGWEATNLFPDPTLTGGPGGLSMKSPPCHTRSQRDLPPSTCRLLRDFHLPRPTLLSGPAEPPGTREPSSLCRGEGLGPRRRLHAGQPVTLAAVLTWLRIEGARPGGRAGCGVGGWMHSVGLKNRGPQVTHGLWGMCCVPCAHAGPRPCFPRAACRSHPSLKDKIRKLGGRVFALLSHLTDEKTEVHRHRGAGCSTSQLPWPKKEGHLALQ